MGDIGEIIREVELEPLEEPAAVPGEAPAPAPAAPSEPDLVPA